MKKINQALHRSISWFAIVLFAVLTLVVVLGVVSRYVLGSQIRWTEELAIFLLVWQVFAGAAIAYRDNAHLGIDLLVRSLDPDASRILQLVALGIVFVFTALVMVYGGAMLTLDRLHAGQMMSTLGIPKALFYLSIPTNGLIILSFNFERFWETAYAGRVHKYERISK